MADMRGRTPYRGKTTENSGKVFKRLMKYVMKNYAPHIILVAVLILISVLANIQGTLFIQSLIDDYIAPMLVADTPDFGPLARGIMQVAVFYLIGVAAAYAYNRIMINVTQGTLRNVRNDLFSHMETLPIKYFDTHSHGDIMSIFRRAARPRRTDAALCVRPRGAGAVRERACDLQSRRELSQNNEILSFNKTNMSGSDFIDKNMVAVNETLDTTDYQLIVKNLGKTKPNYYYAICPDSWSNPDINPKTLKVFDNVPKGEK